MNTIKKNTEVLIDVSKEVGLEMITGKLSMSWHIDPLLGETSKHTMRQRPSLASGPRNSESSVDSGVLYVVCSEIMSCDRLSSVQLVRAVQGVSCLVSELVS
jgi:hypothetical protein